MDWNAAAPAAIVGALVATVGVFLLEMWLKPQLARSRAAVILATELRLNSRLIDLALEHRKTNPHLVSETFQLSMRAWDAAAGEVHHLSPGTLRPLLLVYNQFREINSLVQTHSSKGDLAMQLEGSMHARFLLAELEDAERLFGVMLPSIQAQIARTLVHLDRAIATSLAPVNSDE